MEQQTKHVRSEEKTGSFKWGHPTSLQPPGSSKRSEVKLSTQSKYSVIPTPRHIQIVCLNALKLDEKLGVKKYQERAQVHLDPFIAYEGKRVYLPMKTMEKLMKLTPELYAVKAVSFFGYNLTLYSTMDNVMEGGGAARDDIIGKDFVETIGRTKKEAKKKAALYIKNELIRPQNYEKEAGRDVILSTDTVPPPPFPQKYSLESCADDSSFVTIQLRIRCPKKLLKVDIKDIVPRYTGGNNTLHPCHVLEDPSTNTVITDEEDINKLSGMLPPSDNATHHHQQQQQQHRAEEKWRNANKGQPRRPPSSLTVPFSSYSSSSSSSPSFYHKQPNQPPYYKAHNEGSATFPRPSHVAPVQQLQRKQQQQQQQRQTPLQHQRVPPLIFQERERVLALYAGEWYPAHISRIRHDHSSVVVLYDGYPNEPTLLPYDSVRKTGDGIA
eukprot:jgi/Bigna1/137945/aug1.42_g12653